MRCCSVNINASPKGMNTNNRGASDSAAPGMKQD
jgi:hypothetical protein